MSKSDPCERAALEHALCDVKKAVIVVLSAWLLSMAILAVLRPDPYASLWQVVLGQIVAGRVFGVSLSLNLDYDFLFILYQSGLQDVFLLLVLYPLLIEGYRRAARMSVVGPVISNIREKAEHNKKRVRPFGAIGLAVFVFIPVWGTGAVAGGIVGHLAGIRMPINIAAITAGNLLAVAAWVLLFDFMRELSAQAAEQAPWFILVAAVATLAVLQLMYLRRMWRKRRAIRETAREEDAQAVHEQPL